MMNKTYIGIDLGGTSLKLGEADGAGKILRQTSVPSGYLTQREALDLTDRALGAFLARFGVRFVMTWYGGVLAASAVAFPLMYRTARGAFEGFDETLAYSAQTLGLSNAFIFWRIRMPACRQGILAGAVLAFARALGEYGATSMLVGYTPGKTATISTTVYQLWRTGDEAGALLWVLVNMAVSALTLVAVNMLEDRQKRR